MNRVRNSLALVVCVLMISSVTAQEKRGRTFVDALEQPIVGDPQLSPDGKQILFTIDKADWKANRRIGHIYRINADGTNQVQLTFGDRGENSPRWSPDGKLDRVHDAARSRCQQPDLSAQRRRRRSAPAHESRRPRRATLTWAPDGKSIYFVAADAKSAEEKERDRVQDDVYAFEENNFKQRHLWTTDLDGKTKTHHRRRLVGRRATS